MPKRFRCFFRRYYGELEDDQEYDLIVENELDALLLLVADLKGVHASTASEAAEKAKLFLDDELGAGWTIQDFLNSNVELWPDSSMCYEVVDIMELEESRA